jgi:DNA methylase
MGAPVSESAVADVLAGRKQWCVVEGDAYEVTRGLTVDAVCMDPPYGLGEAAGKNRTRGTDKVPATDYGDDAWDDAPVPQATLDAIRSAGRWQIIFGGNYYALPPSSCWLVWDKQTNGDFADCELAWTNLPRAVRRIVWMWNGMLRRGHEPRYHPTQKPVGVMLWVLSWLPPSVVTVLDPYCGSGTTGVAALRTGRRFIGVESSPRWAAVARERLEAEANTTTLEAARSGQGALFGDVGR